MTFRVGQKVVYFGPDFRVHPLVTLHRMAIPIPREVYTIRCYAPRVEAPGYLLNEIHNPEGRCPRNGLCEMAIDARFLRPIVERKTDISIFTKMLTPEGVDA